LKNKLSKIIVKTVKNLKEGLRWLDQAVADMKTAKDCQVILLKSFKKMRDEGNSFIEEVLLTGKILYGKIS